MQDKDLIFSLIQRLEKVELQLTLLQEEILALKSGLNKYKYPKNSSNSSMPPSKDENHPKRTSSLRERTGKSLGGQKGHKGKTLEMAGDPDIIERHIPLYCSGCGCAIEHCVPEELGKRQVVDIPIIKAIVTEHQVFARTCTCGHTTKGEFPSVANAPVSYGSGIEALTGYFHARQYLPFARMQELFNDVFNIDISEGGIHCLLDRFAKKATPAYQGIRERVEVSNVVGSDETGAKVNGDRHWFWTWQTKQLTYIAHSRDRGKQTISTHFPLGFPNATLVSDAWGPQLSTPARLHQCCLSHLQRNLKYLGQLYKDNKWANGLLKLFYEAIELDRGMGLKDYYGRNLKRDMIIGRFDQLLYNPPDKGLKELYTFYKRMSRDRAHVFTFLFVPEVPPDNNGSERAIRNVKVKQKISGQFKTVMTANNFAIIRSVIDTMVKNGLGVVDGLSAISKFALLAH